MYRQQSAAVPSRLRRGDGRRAAQIGLPSNSPAWNSDETHSGLALLLEAVRYARELDRSPWDFAVEIADLREAGLTTSALRWLVCKGYAEHARELTSKGRTARSFRRSKGLRFDRQTCFVLTESGLAFAQDILTRQRAAKPPDGNPVLGNGNGMDGILRPTWDSQRRELRVGPYVVKQFKVPADNQKAILAAFEEEGWPARVDDPLAPQPEQDPKRRLHDTINSLNRNQRHRVLRFTGDGSGEGVCWSLVRSDEDGGVQADPAR